MDQEVTCRGSAEFDVEGDGGQGTCSGGQCVEVDLCEGVICDDTGDCVECNSDGQCASGEACVDNVCESVAEVLYSQDFEALDAAASDALANDGWLYFGNVYDSTGGFKFGFGPFVAPTTSGQISGIATGEGGPDQGAQQLVVFSNYDCCQPGEGHFGTDLVQTIVFQEIKPIPQSFIG